MDVNTLLLGAISALLSISLYILASMNSRISELKNDMNVRLDKIDKDVDELWRNVRVEENRITAIETKIEKD